jgi:adenylate kinase family enzyme
LLFGNSGSGKSTLASHLSSATMAHLDLDSLAWLRSAAAAHVADRIQSLD